MLNLTKQEWADAPTAIVQGIRGLGERKKLTGLALAIHEANQSVLERLGLVSTSEFEMNIPSEIFSRAAMQVGTYGSGGAFVATQISGDVEEVLRAYSVCERAGARRFTNLTGNLAIVRETAAASYSFYPEGAGAGGVVGADISTSDPTAGQFNLSPARCSTATTFSKQAAAQNPAAAQFLLASLATGYNKAKDRAGLVGSGISGEPRGIVSTSGTGGVTAGGAMVWSKIISTTGYEGVLLAANVDPDRISFVGHPSVKARWRAIQRFSGVQNTLWDSDRDFVAGHPAYTSTVLSSTTGVVAGDFSKLIFAEWGNGLRVVVNPFTLSTSDKLSLVVEGLFDCGVVNPAAFTIALDSAVV